DLRAAHIGETEFAAGLFYLYICVNASLLKKNLSDDADLTKTAAAALAEAAAKISPTGKQNSFASRAYASYILAETGAQQPRSLSVAFLKPVGGSNYLEDSIKALTETRESMEKVYGPCASAHKTMKANPGEGTLEEIIEFIKEAVDNA
ncbi:MAG: type I-E CRISPR-associated protein Cas7/Cse4/CasC, partial [Nitrospinota bacterium]|nr:type I-E CRISPR-associated protein Cas7/Cse4/CasC [Nitrospinota bacterium]